LNNLLWLFLRRFLADVSFICWCNNPSYGAWKGEQKRVQVEGIAGRLLLYVLLDTAQCLLCFVRLSLGGCGNWVKFGGVIWLSK